MTFDDHVQVDADLLESGLLVFPDQRAHVEQDLERDFKIRKSN